MAEYESQPPPLRGRTTGTPANPARDLAAPALAFDLPAEIERLHQEAGWTSGERAGKTLVKEPDFRVVLTVMKRGSRLPRHETDGRISIHVLSGTLTVRAREQPTEMSAGHVLVLDRNISHEVDAREDCAFLLTIAWPERNEDVLPVRSDE